MVFFLLVMFLSNCYDSVSSNNLNGRWRTIEDPPYDTDSLYDSIVFTPPNTLSFYYINKGRIDESSSMKYIHERKEKLLKIIKEKDTSTLQIIRLEPDIMEIKPIQSSRVTKFYRIQ